MGAQVDEYRHADLVAQASSYAIVGSGSILYDSCEDDGRWSIWDPEECLFAVNLIQGWNLAPENASCDGGTPSGCSPEEERHL